MISEGIMNTFSASY